jgi:hypothetical protein
VFTFVVGKNTPKQDRIDSSSQSHDNGQLGTNQYCVKRGPLADELTSVA